MFACEVMRVSISSLLGTGEKWKVAIANQAVWSN